MRIREKHRDAVLKFRKEAGKTRKPVKTRSKSLKIPRLVTPTTNKQIRKWYLKELAKLLKMDEEWIKDGISLRKRARLAWRYRHDKRVEARAFMQNKSEVLMLNLRDQKKYGTSYGPTFDFLVRQLKQDGVKGNDIFEAIIKGSYRTDAGVNKEFGF